MPLLDLVPNWLSQPILPGWFNVTVNNRNSRSPQTEEDIVREHSYGRQLGSLTEAVVALIQDRHAAKGDDRFQPLLKLHEKIDAIKQRSKADRLNRLVAELALLEKEDREELNRLLRRFGREGAA